MPTATLVGNRRSPELVLSFHPHTRVPAGVRFPDYPARVGYGGRRSKPGRPRTLLDWVKGLPGRRFDRSTKTWTVYNPGPEADRVMSELGFTLDLSRGAKAGVRCLADLASPVLRLDEDDEWTTLLYPRFSPVEPPTGSVWDKGRGVWLVHTPDAARLGLDPEVQEAAKRLLSVPRPRVLGTDPHPNWPQVFARLPRAPKRLPYGVPELPSWSPINLYGYQVAGAYALISGHNLLADEPGLGKTYQAIAAHAMVSTRRLVVTCPPVALTNWGKEITTYGLATDEPNHNDRDGVGELLLIRPGRKLKPFPKTGVVVVPHSLLAAKPDLVKSLKAWSPDGLVVDESHYMKTWASARSRAVRTLAQSITGLRIPISGTAMLAHPEELASQLAISGHLDEVFGGLATFLETYTTDNGFGGRKPRRRALAQLRQELDAHVWTRRQQADVYGGEAGGPTMPAVLTPRVRMVDVDLAGYRKALTRQHEVIDQWLDDLGRPATQGDIEEFCAGAIGFISPLRKAAALAKVPAAVEYLQTWLDDQEGPDGQPLLVWTHHAEVTAAMSKAVSDTGAPVAVIDGSTSATKRGQITNDFQHGKYPALVCSLHAAGVALTLTRASDNLFVETDWTPAVLTQARDRTHRIGQTRPITLTTLVATGTLDEHLQRVQRAKAADLDIVMGTGNDTSVMKDDGELATPRQIVHTMVTERIAARRRRSGQAA